METLKDIGRWLDKRREFIVTVAFISMCFMPRCNSQCTVNSSGISCGPRPPEGKQNLKEVGGNAVLPESP